MSLENRNSLSPCLVNSNCTFVEWKFSDIDKKFLNLIEIAKHLPRTVVIEEEIDYWHGVSRSLVFRFPDDLEILKLSNRNVIQVRSASRIGVSDLGVNRNRVNLLYERLMKI